jgi:hypothetical protein
MTTTISFLVMVVSIRFYMLMSNNYFADVTIHGVIILYRRGIIYYNASRVYNMRMSCRDESTSR